ncbi:MAG TPA: hypothetical protein VFF70_11200 [Anaerolineae bacterium]|jgi:hypothetical protein|nr:hypothetical protein [Anaerolineae bacterium]
MSDFLKTLSTVPGAVVLIALLITAALLVVLTNWRLLIFALGAQYLLTGLLLSRAVPIELGMVKALVGIMICPVLYITARRVKWGHLEDDEIDNEKSKSRLAWLISPGLPMRLIIATTGVVLSLSLALRNPLPITGDQVVSRDITIGTYALLLLGLLNMALNENPLKVGLGLLSLLTGFELFYTVVQPALTIVGLLGLTNLIIALAIAYLTIAWATHPHEVQP